MLVNGGECVISACRTIAGSGEAPSKQIQLKTHPSDVAVQESVKRLVLANDRMSRDAVQESCKHPLTPGDHVRILLGF
jgi:hypothetical protein